MYRPKGWETLRAKNNPRHCLAPNACVGQSFEAGADAILEALTKDGDYRTIGWYDDIGDIDVAGWLVFIEEGK